MKKSNYLLIPLFVLIFSVSHKADAQAIAIDWKPLFLDVAGRTIVGGVEVFAQVNKCKEDDVVFLKIINHNQHTVTVKWYDAVLTPQQVWIKKDNSTEQKIITIEPDKEVKGDCVSTNYTECVIKIKDFVDKPANYQEYAVYHFEVKAVMK
ncbi:MAG: hypothetical protein V4511_05825 [Bacteroidota bacterium]